MQLISFIRRASIVATSPSSCPCVPPNVTSAIIDNMPACIVFSCKCEVIVLAVPGRRAANTLASLNVHGICFPSLNIAN
ncbi:hypothetical protein E2C01_057272 [Portunus trituberculatus]|uniref:Uncharacterized protein n=1 Tax=Portunus trituberculatus TaxID=210409 RepID=A0A5B7H1X6_PORTR|nr:hypothetical protein [Portunus trituberculatus]